MVPARAGACKTRECTQQSLCPDLFRWHPIRGHIVAVWRMIFNNFRFVLRPLLFIYSYIVLKMARQRRGKHSLDSSKDHADRTKFPRRRGKESSFKPFLIVAAVLGVSLCLLGAYKFWNYRLSSRLYTPLNAPLVINKTEMDMSRFWGTYRSNLYFGLR